MFEQRQARSVPEGVERETQEEQEKALLRVVIQRHGPKLSAAGEKNQLALYFAESVKQGFRDMNVIEGDGLVHVSTSPVQRAVDTARIDMSELSQSLHRVRENVVTKEALAVPFQPPADTIDPRFSRDLDVIVKMQKSIEPTVREQVESQHPNVQGEVKEAEVRNMIDMEVLSALFQDEIAEKKTFETSYLELAEKFAARYKGFSRHLGMLQKYQEQSETERKQPEDEPYVQIDITHSFPVTCFLKEYLVFDDGVRAADLSAEEFFERTGGIIRESGSLEMQFFPKSETGAKEQSRISVRGSFGAEKSFSGTIDF